MLAHGRNGAVALSAARAYAVYVLMTQGRNGSERLVAALGAHQLYAARLRAGRFGNHGGAVLVLACG